MSIRVTLTEEEAKALFVECNCCAPREAWESANAKIYAKLVKAGVYDDS